MIRYFLCLFCLLSGLISAGFANSSSPPVASSMYGEADHAGADSEAATKLTALTSLSISPMLVGGGRSAFIYLHASDIERQHLPWNASPWYWGPLLAIGFSFFLAHIIGTSVPFLGKTVEAARNLESKFSLIYASPLFLAAGTELLGTIERAGISILPVSSAIAASTSVTNAPTGAFFGGFLGLSIFGVIWLSNQAMHAIVLLSPSALLGTILRLAHFLVLGILFVAAVISPLLGATLALLIIFISITIAGWSMRLCVFGTVFAWDLLRFIRKQPVTKSLLAFSSSALTLPRRTLGRLISTKDGLAFVYRPWLIGPSRVAAISGAERILRYGVFYSDIAQLDNRRKLTILILPPRYRGSEVAVALFVGCKATPSPLKGGMRAALTWVKEI
ncbi:MAG: hypothetical protein M3Y65_18705 [Pseudomonadota bacterium]|nr:hypothetical protein [Pseudomonadota bacterium]